MLMPRFHDGIHHIFVLALENRSFDHVFGADPSLRGTFDPTWLTSVIGQNQIVTPGLSVSGQQVPDQMNFDPPHEYLNVFQQLSSSVPGSISNFDPNKWVEAIQTGYLAANKTVPSDCFDSIRMLLPDQTSVLGTLARQYALCTAWHASVPSSTWPNRFFFHAASSAGFFDGPSSDQAVISEIFDGFSFSGKTVYHELGIDSDNWRIFYGGPMVPQVYSLEGMTPDHLARNYSNLSSFLEEVSKPDYSAAYTFIEPNYGNFINYLGGNSQHSLGSFKAGEALVRYIYESLRNSPIWRDSLLIITYDEHGGFYDHVIPPNCVSPGGKDYYRSMSQSYGAPIAKDLTAISAMPGTGTVWPTSCAFTQLGFRVPAVIISPYISAGTRISTVFDHSSIPKTLAIQYGLSTLSNRGEAANHLLDASIVSPAAVQAVDETDQWSFPASAPSGSPSWNETIGFDVPIPAGPVSGSARAFAMLQLRPHWQNQTLSFGDITNRVNSIRGAITMKDMDQVLSSLP